MVASSFATASCPTPLSKVTRHSVKLAEHATNKAIMFDVVLEPISQGKWSYPPDYPLRSDTDPPAERHFLP